MKEDAKQETAVNGRRKFLKTAAVAAGAASVATLGFPMVSRAQTTVLKMQGAWGAKDIFNDYATDYAKRVNEMAGGRLKIQYLIAGSVVKAFQVQDAVNKGVLDGGHQVAAYWYGKSKAASLFGTGPVFGQDAHQILAWIYYGGGLELYNELMDQLKLNLVGFFCMPMPPQPLGWFKKEIKGPEDLTGLKYRTVGLATDLFQAMGVKVTQLPGGEIVPALERGVIEAFEYNNPTSDRSFGAQDVSKVYMMGSYHQAAESFEVIFNKTKYNALEKDQQAMLKYASEAASSANFWRGQDQYSKDLEWLRDKAGVKIYKTPKSVFQAQLAAWDKILPDLEKDPMFAKIVKSQKEFSKRVAYYSLVAGNDYKLAYDHYFPGNLPF